MDNMRELKPRKLWSEKEDNVLRSEVARQECAKRWLHFLNPSLNHGEWSEQEDARLLAAVERGGRNWRKIVDEILQGRSATDAKNRHAILQRNRKNGASAGPDRQRASFSRRRRNGITLETAENNDTNNWWPTDSMDLMRDILHYNVPIGSAEAELPSGSNIDSPLIEQPSQVLVSLPKEAPMHEYPQSYGNMGESSSWQVGPSSHSYQEKMNDHGFEFPANCVPGSFGNGNDGCMGITDTFFEVLTTMTEMEGAVGLQTPSDSSHSAECLLATQETKGAIGHTGGEEPVKEGGEDEEEEENECIHGASMERSEELLINSEYHDPSLPSIEEILGTVSKENRKSTMILQHMQSDQVGQVLGFLFSSNSAVDVKIISED
ncbi:hypothetical protein MaudMau93_004273 [Microsporum audouinii]